MKRFSIRTSWRNCEIGDAILRNGFPDRVQASIVKSNRRWVIVDYWRFELDGIMWVRVE